MAGVFDPYSHFQGPHALAVSKFLGAWKAQPIVKAIDAWHRPGDLTHVVPGAALKSYVSVPMHTPGLARFNGRFTFDENSGRVATVERGTWQKGSKINELKGAEYDIGMWSKAPGTVAIEIGNNAPLSLVYILNGCFSGIPRTAGGTSIYLPGTTIVDPALTAYEQVYFDYADKQPLVVLDSDTGDHRSVNPFKPSFQSDFKWWNAKENDALNAPNITAAIKNMQIRRAMNGVELGIGDEGLEIWVPYSSKEDVRLLLEVFRQLPGTGTAAPADAIQVPITGGGGLSQVIYSVQDNPVFGRARVRAITGMRSDLWCIVAPNVLREPSMSLFVHAHGGNVGEYSINEDPNPDGNNVPHIWVYPWGKGSPLWAGTMEGSKAGDIGISMLVNEGFAGMTGLLLEARFTGSAS
jgi:hypothetical protein